MLTIKGKNNGDGSFNWKDTFIDAIIVAGLTFFSSLGGISLVGANVKQALLGSGIASAVEFFIFLAIKRGLREKQSQA